MPKLPVSVVKGHKRSSCTNRHSYGALLRDWREGSSGSCRHLYLLPEVIGYHTGSVTRNPLFPPSSVHLWSLA